MTAHRWMRQTLGVHVDICDFHVIIGSYIILFQWKPSRQRAQWEPPNSVPTRRSWRSLSTATAPMTPTTETTFPGSRLGWFWGILSLTKFDRITWLCIKCLFVTSCKTFQNKIIWKSNPKITTKRSTSTSWAASPSLPIGGWGFTTKSLGGQEPWRGCVTWRAKTTPD